MELLDTFGTIAEIAITLAGLTGVVVAFGRGGPTGWSPVERFLLRALVFWSLGAMFLALLPAALFSLPSVQAPWRVAHGFFAVFHTTVFVWFFGQTRRFPSPPNGARLDWAIVAVGCGVLAVETLVALGFLAELAPFLYLVALLWFLLLAVRVFVALVFPRGPASPPTS